MGLLAEIVNFSETVEKEYRRIESEYQRRAHPPKVHSPLDALARLQAERTQMFNNAMQNQIRDPTTLGLYSPPAWGGNRNIFGRILP